MSKGNPNPSPSTRFGPGNNANPNGRPKNVFSKVEVEEAIGRFLRMSFEDVEKMSQDKSIKTLDKIIASIIVSSDRQGDLSRLSGLLDRAIGKVAEVRENHNISRDAELASEPKPKLYEFIQKAGNE